MLNGIKSLLRRAYYSDNARRIFHTFYQAAGGVLLAGLIAARSSSDVKLAVAAALTVGLAAVKALFLAKKA